jgi:class 3 adenylate cyclase
MNTTAKQSFYTFILIVWSAICLTAQNNTLQDMENAALGAWGPNRVEKTIQYAEALLAAGQYEKAAEWAEEAADFAKKIREQKLRAVALNRQGKAMMLAGKRKVAGRFEQSNDILAELGNPLPALMQENLGYLRELALRSDDKRELAKIDARLNQMRGAPAVIPPPVAPAGPPPEALVTKADLRHELAVLQQKLAPDSKASDEEKMRFLQENKMLQAELAAKESEIDQMTEEQMKTSMILLEHRYLLDSLDHKFGMDSLTMSNKDLALREEKSNQRFYIAGLIALLLLAGGSMFSYVKARQYAKTLEVKNTVIREEQQRSENLLLNILPALIAEELKAKGHTTARPFDDVGVLFADFIGFSHIAEQVSAEQLVSDLDTCFQAFDAIIVRFGLEKIKTIGDAYMCASGLPNGGGSQIRAMVDAALAIQQWLSEWNTERDKKGLPRYEARIGIHRGPVVAGVVGSKKFAFDIWGDTVNIAARIEQAGASGRVNISGEAYQIIKAYYKCQYRGKVAVKNKGEIDMYFIGEN